MRVAMITMGVGMVALLCGGCDPVTTGVMAGGSLAANALFGDSKMTQVAREAFVRASICSARPNGIPNGRTVMIVRTIGWYSFYPLPDGRSIAAESGKSLVVIEYEIANPGDRDVLVNPERALLADADGKIAQETAGIGGLQTGKLSLDDDALLHGGESWQMLSVFEVPPGEYAVLVPSGRTADEPNPHRLVGCRFPGPVAIPRS
jgi:hypothetical protein